MEIDLLDKVPDLPARLGVHSRRGLVEENDLGVSNQADRD